MAIVYPLALPAGALFARCEFLLNTIEAVNVMPSGGLLATEVGTPAWTMKAETVPLFPGERARWQAWKLALRGSIGTFLAYDPDKEYPGAYGADVLGMTRAAGGAFDGNGALMDYTSEALAFGALPAGYQILAGDMLAVAGGGRRMLHMALNDVVADGAGVVDALEVMPPVYTPGMAAAGLGAPVALVRPSCIMRIMPESFTTQAEVGPTAVSFEAVQVIV
jgi:hypothetical protein